MPGPAEEAFLPSLPKAPRRGSLSTRHVSPQPESPVQRHCISIKLSPVLSAGTLSLPLWCLSLLVFWPFLALEDHLANPEVRPTCLLMADPPTLSRSLWAPLVVGMFVCVWGGGLACTDPASFTRMQNIQPRSPSSMAMVLENIPPSGPGGKVNQPRRKEAVHSNGVLLLLATQRRKMTNPTLPHCETLGSRRQSFP